MRQEEQTDGGHLEREEERGALRRFLGLLPDDLRIALALRFQDEMTYREISQVMGISLGMVSRLVAAALSDLREQLRGKINLVREV